MPGRTPLPHQIRPHLVPVGSHFQTLLSDKWAPTRWRVNEVGPGVPICPPSFLHIFYKRSTRHCSKAQQTKSLTSRGRAAELTSPMPTA